MFFEEAFRETVGVEGGFTKDPRDKGNWTGGKVNAGVLKGTKWGISAASYPDLDIENLSLDDAKRIYKRDYWDRLHLDRCCNGRVSGEIFDTAVNCGVHDAVLIAQKAANYLGEALVEDGSMGPKTMDVVNKWCEKDPEAFFIALNGFQFMHYVAIVEANPDFHLYARGWMKRIQEYRKG